MKGGDAVRLQRDNDGGMPASNGLDNGGESAAWLRRAGGTWEEKRQIL